MRQCRGVDACRKLGFETEPPPWLVLSGRGVSPGGL